MIVGDAADSSPGKTWLAPGIWKSYCLCLAGDDRDFTNMRYERFNFPEQACSFWGAVQGAAIADGS